MEFEAGEQPKGEHAYLTWYNDCVGFSYDGIPWRTIRSTERTSTISGRTVDDLLVEVNRWGFDISRDAYIIRHVTRPQHKRTLKDLRDMLQKAQPRADIGQFPTLMSKPIREYATTKTIHLENRTVEIYVLARYVPLTQEEWDYYDFDKAPDENLAFLTFYEDNVDFTHYGEWAHRRIDIDDKRCVTIYGSTIERLLGEVKKEYRKPIPEDCFIMKVAYTREYGIIKPVKT